MSDVLGPLIDGVRSVVSSDGVTSVRNPATGEEIARVGREQGMAALEHYTEYKSVFIADD